MSKEPLMFYDKVKKELTPLRVLVIGKDGAGKKTFVNRLHELHPGFISQVFGEGDMSDVNVVIGAPDQKGLDYVMEREYFTHVFWVDDGARVQREEDYKYELSFDPHRMVLVDNSLGLEHLYEEVGYTMLMMGLIKL